MVEKVMDKELLNVENSIEESQKMVVEQKDKKEKAGDSEKVAYAESGIDDRILRAVTEMGFEYMTPIQEKAIPVFMSGKDVIGQAQTGTGKTAAFGIPVIQSIDTENRNLQALILCPTRELAIQAADEMRNFAKYTHGIKIVPIYGGQDITRQIKALKGNVQIIVGTPGRVMDHMRRRTIKLDHIKMMVLDEADEMLNMGFREDIETILKDMPQERQTALFSATMPKAILDITKMYQKEDAEHIQMVKKELTISLIKQYYYEVPGRAKADVVCRLLDYYNPKRSLVFCNTKRMVDELTETLKTRGYLAEGLHGDLSQNQRDTVMNLFRNGRADILIATDVAARGIDVDDVEAVFNYDIPQDIEYYIHRIGRTGRAGKTGRAFTLVVGKEIFKIRDIERACKSKMQQREIPSTQDVTDIKAEKVLNQVMDTLQSQSSDLEEIKEMIHRRLKKEGFSPLDLAAAFLKQEMGEELKEIVVEKFVPFNRYDRKNGRDYGKRNQDSNGRRRNSQGNYYGNNPRKNDSQKSEYRKPGNDSSNQKLKYQVRKNPDGTRGEHSAKGKSRSKSSSSHTEG